MGFLKKIFRRKGVKAEQTSNKKETKAALANQSSNKKDKKKKNSPRKASDGKIRSETKAVKSTKTSENSATKNDNEEAFIQRTPSFTGTTGTRASSLSRGEQGYTNGGNDFRKQQQKPETRVLSPRNSSNKVLPDVVGKSTSNGKKKDTLKSGPVDLDEDVAFGDETDENNDMSNIRSSDAPGLSYQQLQQFNKQQQQQQQQQQVARSPHQLYDMSPEKVEKKSTPVGGKQSSDSSNCSSSDFNLSTDAEDTEYNNLKRRGVIPSPYAPPSINVSGGALDTSGISFSQSIADDDTNIFPELQNDNDTSAVSNDIAMSPAPPPNNSVSRKQVAPLVVDDEPEPDVEISPMANETEDDMRAWTVDPAQTSTSSKENFSPSFSASKDDANNNFSTTANNKASDGFANFADFDSVNFQNEIQSPNTNSSSSSKKKRPPRTTYHFEDFGNNNDFVGGSSNNGSSRSRNISSSSSAANPESPLSDLLAKAKEKRSSRSQRHRTSASSSSVNSAPVITPAYLREQHNLKSSHSNDKNNNSASVSDIIENLEATNAARVMNSSSRRSGSSKNGDSVSGSVRSAKDRLRAKRRKERKERDRSRSGDSDDDSGNEEFLFQEVAGALGPRGAGADMESLSGRSKSSTGNKSNRSHRSHRSQRSSRRRKKTSSGESVSVGSKGSRGSRHSRSSRYSHRSTRSYLSHMSEQSRSVANDLLRLEMQLAMVGSQDASARDSSTGRSGASMAGSTGGASRTSRGSRSSARRSSSGISHRTKVNVVAPAGKLGIILANKADSKGTVVSGVRTSSVLVDKISPGDRIIAIDGEDVSRMTVSEITTIMARKADFERTLTVLTTPKQKTPSKSSGGASTAKSPSRSSAYNSGTATDGSVGNSSYNYRR